MIFRSGGCPEGCVMAGGRVAAVLWIVYLAVAVDNICGRHTTVSQRIVWLKVDCE